jgi:ADP-heptose:LPS heptosyltransferase
MHFFSLQKLAGAEQAKSAPPGMRLTDFTPALQDFADTAALVSELDLVITIDTAAAHLAGALGKPVWILLPFAGGWRWLTDRSDSPWYPTARLFRQPKPGDWKSVIDQVLESLVTHSTKFSL